MTPEGSERASTRYFAPMVCERRAGASSARPLAAAADPHPFDYDEVEEVFPLERGPLMRARGPPSVNVKEEARPDFQNVPSSKKGGFGALRGRGTVAEMGAGE